MVLDQLVSYGFETEIEAPVPIGLRVRLPEIILAGSMGSNGLVYHSEDHQHMRIPMFMVGLGALSYL